MPLKQTCLVCHWTIDGIAAVGSDGEGHGEPRTDEATQHLCRSVPIMMTPETLFGIERANYAATNWAAVDINLVAIFSEDAITHTPLKCRVTLFESISLPPHLAPQALVKIGHCFEVGRRVPCLHLNMNRFADLSLKFCKQMTIIPAHVGGPRGCSGFERWGHRGE